MHKQYDALALFSGGLDSILACKVVQDQGLKVLGLHFMSPFFGKPHKIEHWSRIYGVDILPVDVSTAYVEMFLTPPNGYGQHLNPCLDCKILMLSHARAMLDEYGAKFLISGEVVGQRPMSQRRDALNMIRKRAGVRDLLLRPLCAKKLEPTPMEESGLVDRERLLDIGGRGRKRQLALARETYRFKEIPTPAGGCLLTEAESVGRYYFLLRNKPCPSLSDFRLACTGRQLWSGGHWLSMGRNQADNAALAALAEPGDLTFDLRNYPSPLSLARPLPGVEWDTEVIRSAAALAASYSPKAVRAGTPVDMLVSHRGRVDTIAVLPDRAPALNWAEPDTDGLREWKIERGQSL
ncbi:MAG: tRNA(5-methylaminomethyl-2-thiouridylate) methyltransferase [Desulfovibrionaceae bacterium]